MDTLYAWAAGFIDGEGTISIKRFYRYRENGSKYIYYQPFISLSQAIVGGHEKGVLEMKRLFGGSIAKWKDKRSVRYPTMQWSVVSLNAQECIEAIYPYLICKKANADIIKDFFDNRVVSVGGSGKITLPKSEVKRREMLFNKSRLLNQKGKLYLQRLSEVTPKGDATV